MRSVYLDESGISSAKHDTFVVVAGVILHKDQQWQALNEGFQTIIEQYVPAEKRAGFVFHAKDIWHGSGAFDRKTYQHDRAAVLDALVGLLVKLELPVVWGVCNRLTVEEHLNTEYDGGSEKRVKQVAYMAAFFDAVLKADTWASRYAPSEFLEVVIENNYELRMFAKGVYKKYRNQDKELLEVLPGVPMTRIVESPNFVYKDDSPPLQLADLCAFIIMRRLKHCAKIARYVDPIVPLMRLTFDEYASVDFFQHGKPVGEPSGKYFVN